MNRPCSITACLDSGRTAVDKMLRVLDAMRRESLPGCLELPRDSLTRPVPRPLPPLILPAVALVADLQRRAGLALLEWMGSRERRVVLALCHQPQRQIPAQQAEPPMHRCPWGSDA